MKNFEIDPKYLTTVTIHKEWFSSKYHDMSDEEKLISKIKGENHRCISTSSLDHPEFAKLREQLGDEGYIKIERGWWNGDVVIKPFILNGVIFEIGEEFQCGAAIGYTMSNKLNRQKDKALQNLKNLA